MTRRAATKMVVLNKQTGQYDLRSLIWLLNSLVITSMKADSTELFCKIATLDVIQGMVSYSAAAKKGGDAPCKKEFINSATNSETHRPDLN